MERSSAVVLAASRSYGTYVNETRAIPQLGDGLKDAARKALHVMRGRGRIKTVALSGAMTEQKLYVHGDASDSINTLAAHFGNNVPLLTGLGLFGTKVDPITCGASRYTEVEKPPYADALVYLDYDVVPMRENYDSSVMHPATLLPPLPLLLVNGAEGVGIGWATNILPRDIADVCAAVHDVIAGRAPKRVFPKFPWAEGAKVEFLGYGDRGGCAWRLTGRAEVVDTSTVRVTELPPFFRHEKFKDFLNDLEEEGKINGYEDRSSSEIDVEVRFKRGSLKGWSEADVVKFLKLSETCTENFVVVSPGGDKILTYRSVEGSDPVAKYLEDWVAWRFSFYKLRYERLKRDASERSALLKLIAATARAGVPNQKHEDRAALEAKISAAGSAAGLSPIKEHVSHVSAMPLYRWTKKLLDEVAAEASALEEHIAECSALIADEAKRRSKFAAETADLSKSFDGVKKHVAELRGADDKRKKKK